MSLTLEPLQGEHLSSLFAFWRTLGAEIPYFFPVSLERWQSCLLYDQLDGDRKFNQLETYLAFDTGRLLGFIQFGQPCFDWNERGERFLNPAIGVIRHLYFAREFPEAGRVLLAQADHFLERFSRNHAFYHILGMSCNAHHGKLHESLTHVETLLLENGFQIEHENVYFVLDLEDALTIRQRNNSPSSQQKNAMLEVTRATGSNGLDHFEARLAGVPVGNAEVRSLETGTGDPPIFAYLCWIGLAKAQRGSGLGTIFLRAIVECLKMDGYRFLHTDTPSTNIAAQQFYGKFGFCNKGKTRSYIRK